METATPNLRRLKWDNVCTMSRKMPGAQSGLNKRKLVFHSVKVKVAQLCPTLCNPIVYTVHGFLQARILEWVAFPFSRGSPQPRDRTQISCIAGRFLTSWGTREALVFQGEVLKKSLLFFLIMEHMKIQKRRHVTVEGPEPVFIWETTVCVCVCKWLRKKGMLGF